MKLLFQLETVGDPDDRMISVETGCIDGHGKTQIAVINTNNVVGSVRDKERNTCHDCGVKEGEIHQLNCDMESCPFCGGQLITCGCCYIKLGFDYHDFQNTDIENFKEKFTEFKKEYPTNGLPEEIYKNGLTSNLKDKWKKILEEKGRVPYILYPNICRKCGMLWPTMFNIPTEKWEKYIMIKERDKMLCRPCYDQIKEWIDSEHLNSQKHSEYPILREP